MRAGRGGGRGPTVAASGTGASAGTGAAGGTGASGGAGVLWGLVSEWSWRGHCDTSPPGTGRAAAILGGFAADLAFGDPARRHPVAAFGQAALVLERRIWAPRRLPGVAHVALLVGGAAAFGAGLARVSRGGALVACLWGALGGRSLASEAGRIGALVRSGDVDGARARIPRLVGRDPLALDGDGLCRAAVESLAENTVDAVVSPLLWAAVGGAPLVCAHRASNTLDAMVGHHSERYEDFGWAAARLDDGMNWPGARIGAALTVACAPLVGGSPRAARAMWKRDGALHPSPNGGHVEAAFAGALGVRLGGPVSYGGRAEDRPWLGDGAAPTPRDVRRAVALSRLVGGASALLAAGADMVAPRPLRPSTHPVRASAGRRGAMA